MLHDDMRSNTPAARPDTKGPSTLCPRCSVIFLDTNACQGLIQIGQRSPYRIEHYMVSELNKYADLGCALCAVLSRELERFDDQNTGTFFDIHTSSTSGLTGLRSEIVWTATNTHSDRGVEFYFFAELEDPIASIVPNRKILTSFTNTKATKRIEQAFTQCLEQHEDCPRNYMTLLPTRLVDVREMRLHVTRQNETGTYAALSYCWGGDQLFKTTRDNISSMTDSIALEDLPRTLQDAVQVCNQIDIRYLWIDALCIMQGDRDDLAHEISQMGLIYSRATIVISASRAKSVQNGFLTDISDRCQEVIMLPARFSAACEGNISIIQVPREVSVQEPLNERGWTFQESCLASRALIYTDGGIIWQCPKLFDRLAFDGIQMSSHPSEDLPVFNKEFTAGTLQREEWDQLVRTYTLRRFKDQNDRLEALAGIAAMLASLWNDRYYAGLWGHDIVSQLGWKSDNSSVRFKGIWERLEAPSWSWASVDGPVCDVTLFLDRVETPRGAQFISCEVIPAHPEKPFGRVLGGRLTIEAFLVKATDAANSSWLADTCMDFDAMRAEKRDYSKLWCLLLGYALSNSMPIDGSPQWYGLLLIRLGDGTFKRVGWFSQDLDAEYWSDDEVSFDEYYDSLKDEQSLGIEARFPKGGQRKTVVIV